MELINFQYLLKVLFCSKLDTEFYYKNKQHFYMSLVLYTEVIFLAKSVINHYNELHILCHKILCSRE